MFSTIMTDKTFTIENEAIKYRLKVGLVIVSALLGLLLQNSVLASAPSYEEPFDYPDGTKAIDIPNFSTSFGTAEVYDKILHFDFDDDWRIARLLAKDFSDWSYFAKVRITGGCPAIAPFLSAQYWSGTQYLGDAGNFRTGGMVGELCKIQVARRSGGGYLWDDLVNVEMNEWYVFGAEWHTTEASVRYTYDGGTNWSDWKLTFQTDEKIAGVYFDSNVSAGQSWEMDWVALGAPFMPEFRVFGVSPASGTTITDLSDEIVIGWEGFDEWYQNVYGKISVHFRNEKTGISLPAVWIEPATSTSGQKTFTFSDFGLDYANADWHLFARAISGYPWYLMTGDVVSPKYYVKIDIEGQEVLFEMSDWETWYAEKSDKYDTPTEAFSTLAGLVEPIFSQIGNFGGIIIDFLDITEARETGENLAIAIPVLRQYVDEIENLFKGFPVIKIFLLCMVFIIGAFIVKLILKFIPFFG